jgi:hypothetical protein
MPRMSTLLGLCAAFTLTFSAFAQTVERSPGIAPKPGQTMAPPPASEKPKAPGEQVAAPVRRVEALTVEECKGLGGTVQEVGISACNTKQACATVDQSHVVHLACINE